MTLRSGSFLHLDCIHRRIENKDIGTDCLGLLECAFRAGHSHHVAESRNLSRLSAVPEQWPCQRIQLWSRKQDSLDRKEEKVWGKNGSESRSECGDCVCAADLHESDWVPDLRGELVY